MRSKALEYVLPFYNEPHRFYHTYQHLNQVLNTLGNGSYLAENVSDELFYAALFHDIVYVVGADDNEESSYDMFVDYAHDNDLDNVDVDKVRDMILATKDHWAPKFFDLDTQALLAADVAIFAHRLDVVLEYENQIFKEHQQYDINEYRKGRLQFLNSIIDSPRSTDAEKRSCEYLIQYITDKVYKIGIYAGSFNPLHIGHENICQQAERVFDKVILAQGINPEKEIPAPLTNHRQVIRYSGLLTELFSNNEDYADYHLVRGIRGIDDTVAEDVLRSVVHDIDPSISTTYFFCDSQFSHVSSSLCRQIKDVDKNLYDKYAV